jgi:hypothetical protein
MNRGKCHLKLRKTRFRGELLHFYCNRLSHDHGEPHWIMRHVRSDDILVDPDELYAEMARAI